jgi:uncharacterized membrane protein YccC
MPARTTPRLFDASGEVERLRASPLFAIGPAAPGPALRRGFLIAVPVALALTFEFAFDWPSHGAIAAAAFVCGFTALDAPAGPRALWQTAAAPIVGAGAALGVLSSQSAPTAVIAMALVAAASGYCFADTLRLAFVGFGAAVALVLSQGFFLPASDALPALFYGTVGGLTPAAWAGCVWLVHDRAEDDDSGWDWVRTKARLRASWTLQSEAGRHALRFGVALAVGVALYRALGLHDHGYWIPLTLLFVLRPERDETDRRLILRAVGTVLGLGIATGDRAQPLGGAHLRPPHRPVRALHRGDHHLRGAAHRHARRARPPRRRAAGARHRDRDRDRLARLPDLSRRGRIPSPALSAFAEISA